MTDTTTNQQMPPVEPADDDRPAHVFPTYGFAIVFALMVFADWLFYGRAIGLSAALFLLVLAVAATISNKTRVDGRQFLIASIVLILAIVPILIEPGPLAILIGIVATGYFAATVAGDSGTAWRGRVVDGIVLLLDGVWRPFSDLSDIRQNRQKRLAGATGAIAWLTWVVPVALGLVFLLLFASANPLIENWLAALNLKTLFGHLSLNRVLLWLMAIAVVWPFVFVRVRSRLRKPVEAELNEPAPEALFPALPAELFGKTAILRSLVLFNVLFAMQSALDIAYLWGGIALPDGMSYASYAHRGAYPLIVTALLAAAFVLVATRPSSDADRSPFIRNLVFLFTAQNVMLVVSSILRLDLYIEVYSLTYWRIAAFIWMGLVALGLILIVARMALRKSNSWLIGMNLGALVLTLYLCGFVSFPKLIADYNVAHSREVSGQGTNIDLLYLVNLGPQAIPAIDRLLSQSKVQPWRPCQYGQVNPVNPLPCVDARRLHLAVVHEARMQDWRAWSYRDGRLVRYLNKQRDAKAAQASGAEVTAPEKRGWLFD